MRISTLAAVVLGAVCIGAAWALPAAGGDSPPDTEDRPRVPVPAPAPGETAIPPPATIAEDRYVPASAAERREALERLREVALCAREQGLAVPEPVAVDVGAAFPWNDGAPDAATSRGIEACLPALADDGDS